MSDTPITDAFVLKLERELGDGPPNISEAAIDVAVRHRMLALARQLERELAEAEKIGNALARELGEARQISRDAYEEVARLRGFDKP